MYGKTHPIQSPKKVMNTPPNVPQLAESAPKIRIDFEKRTNQVILGIGDIQSSGTPGIIFKTFSLGSCICLTLFTPDAGIIGMAHIALPSSTIDPEKARMLPGYFADSAVHTLLTSIRSLGYAKSSSSLIAKITGGAQTAADQNNHFRIGERNYNTVKEILQSLHIITTSEDCGGTASRTAWIQHGSSDLYIVSNGNNHYII